MLAIIIYWISALLDIYGKYMQFSHVIYINLQDIISFISHIFTIEYLFIIPTLRIKTLRFREVVQSHDGYSGYRAMIYQNLRS